MLVERISEGAGVIDLGEPVPLDDGRYRVVAHFNEHVGENPAAARDARTSFVTFGVGETPELARDAAIAAVRARMQRQPSR